MRFADRVVFITGASRGIGAAVARRAAERGASVGLVARSEADLRATLDAAGGKGAYALGDVADRASITAAIERLAGELGPPDVLVNNAGIGAFGAATDTDADDVERLMRVNFLGVVHATKAALPFMIERRTGHIVNIASIAGRIGAPFEAAYSASKFAVVGWSEAIAIELSAYGIEVSMVHPGPVDTEFFSARGHPYERGFPRPVTAEKVANAVISVVEGNRLERYVPRWLGQAVVVRAAVPGMYRQGTRRTFRKELRELRG